MRLAVALATYNGEAYLAEQLKTILQQSRAPDHVVISDDSSTDNTVAIAEDFQRSSWFPVEILRTGSRLGPMRNFIQAADACDAELIAFCDQDDLWTKNKLARCEQAMLSSSALIGIHSLSYFDNNFNNPWSCTKRIRVSTKTFDGLHAMPNYIARGMSMVFRKSILKPAAELKLLWEPHFKTIAQSRPVSLLDHWSHAHDTYVLMMGRLLGPLTYIGDVLAYARRHDANYSAGGSDWSQSPDIANKFGSGPHVGYLRLSKFCEDFSHLLHDDACRKPLTMDRLIRAQEYYNSWAALWMDRSMLHNPSQPLRNQFYDFTKLIASGCYRGKFKGGVGAGGFVVDALGILGLPIHR